MTLKADGTRPVARSTLRIAAKVLSTWEDLSKYGEPPAK
jgi:hypothetical protein